MKVTNKIIEIENRCSGNGNKTIKQRASHWVAILEELKKVIYYYNEVWNISKNTHEVPYYFSERTSISMLVSAATRKKYLTLEEYPVDKRSGRGRVDLWIGDNSLSFNEIIEAKQCWNVYKLRHKAKEAIKDRGRVVAGEDEFKSSVVFTCHWLEKTKLNEAKPNINKWISEAKKDKYDIALYFFPKKLLDVAGSGKNKYNHFPGLIVTVYLARGRSGDRA